MPSAAAVTGGSIFVPDRQGNSGGPRRLLLAAAASLAWHGMVLAAFLANPSVGPPAGAPVTVPMMLVSEPAGETGTPPVPSPDSLAAPVAPLPVAAQSPPPPSPSPAVAAAEPSLPAPAVPKLKHRVKPPPLTNDTPSVQPATVPAETVPAAVELIPPATLVQAAVLRRDPMPMVPGPGAPAQTEGAPGQAQATAAAAAISPSATPSADYLAAVMAALERHKHYPESARLQREQGTLLLDFAIDRNGRVLAVSVRRGSGSAALDGAAEAMIHEADPLPAPPQSYQAARLELVLPVAFDLQ